MSVPATFQALQGAYNFRLPSDRVALFTSVLQAEVVRYPRPRRVLDIGCGRGIAQSIDAPMVLRSVADEVWGLEPDPKVPQPAHVTHFQHSLMENASIPEASIDLAYSCLVMEHVATPREFMSAVYRCLKPGGAYLFMTMNARHYFVRMARLAKAMRVDELALRVVRPSREVDDYHYPVQYRFNDPATITRICRDCGFESPEFAYVEFQGPSPYFRGPLRPFLHLMNAKRAKLRNPGCLLELYALVRKPR